MALRQSLDGKNLLHKTNNMKFVLTMNLKQNEIVLIEKDCSFVLRKFGYDKITNDYEKIHNLKFQTFQAHASNVL